MEYVVKNETDDSGMMYFMVVEKGYYHPLAFRCIERMKEDFKRFFEKAQINSARYLSLNREFEGSFERIFVGKDYKRRSTLRTH